MPDLREQDAPTCGSLRHPYILFIYSSMYTLPTSDLNVPVRRLQLDAGRGKLVPVERKEPFIKGPIPLDWLSKAAALPGKAINLALALWWLQGMAKGKPFKLTQAALTALNVKRDAASTGLAGLEEVGLIQVERQPGQRPVVSVVGVSQPNSL